MEPERDIEKELKAYAQQRRAAAGAPPPLHPADRKALQAEAARLTKSPDAPSRSWWQTFFGSWPGLAVAGAAAVAVVVASLHLLAPPDNKQERIQSFAAARRPMDEPKAMLAPAPRPAATPAPRPMVLAEKTDSQTKSSRVVREDHSSAVPSPTPATLPAAAPSGASPTTVNLALNAPPPAPIAAPAAATPPPTARMFAPASSALRDRESSLSSGQLAKDVNGSASPGAPATVGGTIAGSTGSFNRLATAEAARMLVTQRFRRTDVPAKQAKVTGISNVLASFKVEQDLGKLRLIDSDGSVYSGSVEETPEIAGQADALLETARSEKQAAAAKKPAQPVRFFRFRVSGTNRTLKEEVVFTGNFLAPGAPQQLFKDVGATTDTAVAPQSLVTTNAIVIGAPATVAPGAAAQPVLFELQKARMEGDLLLGGSNKLQIKAAPVKR